MNERKEDIGEKKRKRYNGSYYNKRIYIYISVLALYFFLKITMVAVRKTNTIELKILLNLLVVISRHLYLQQPQEILENSA